MIRESLLKFWFSPSSPRLLGVGRALFCGALWLDALLYERSLWLDISPVFHTPAFPLGLVTLPPYPVSLALEYAWRVALLFAALGVYTRVAVTMSALLGTYVLALPYNFYAFGYPGNHHYHVVVIILWILAASRCGDSFALDLRRRESSFGPSSDYTWPIRLIWLALCCMFFASAVTKLRLGGWDWVASDNLSLNLIKRHYFGSSAPLVGWGLELSQKRFVCRLLAFSTLVQELAYPLALTAGLARRWRFTILIPLSMIVTLVAVWLLMGPNFWLVIVAHLFWWPTPQADEAPRPTPRSKVLAGICASVILLGSLLDTLLLKDHFPFSCYPMFATVNLETDLKRFVLYGVDQRGREFRLHPEMPAHRANPSLNRMYLHRSFNGLRANPERLQRGVEDCLRRYNKVGADLQGLRLYECRWQVNWRLQNLQTPEKRLLLEVRVPELRNESREVDGPKRPDAQ